jgi:hypothetical protein
MYDIYYKEWEASEQAKKRGDEMIPELSDMSKQMQLQDEFELNFNKHEK